MEDPHQNLKDRIKSVDQNIDNAKQNCTNFKEILSSIENEDQRNALIFELQRQRLRYANFYAEKLAILQAMKNDKSEIGQCEPGRPTWRGAPKNAENFTAYTAQAEGETACQLPFQRGIVHCASRRSVRVRRTSGGGGGGDAAKNRRRASDASATALKKIEIVQRLDANRREDFEDPDPSRPTSRRSTPSKDECDSIECAMEFLFNELPKVLLAKEKTTDLDKLSPPSPPAFDHSEETEMKTRVDEVALLTDPTGATPAHYDGLGSANATLERRERVLNERKARGHEICFVHEHTRTYRLETVIHVTDADLRAWAKRVLAASSTVAEANSPLNTIRNSISRRKSKKLSSRNRTYEYRTTMGEKNLRDLREYDGIKLKRDDYGIELQQNDYGVDLKQNDYGIESKRNDYCIKSKGNDYDIKLKGNDYGDESKQNNYGIQLKGNDYDIELKGNNYDIESKRNDYDIKSKRNDYGIESGLDWEKSKRPDTSNSNRDAKFKRKSREHVKSYKWKDSGEVANYLNSEKYPPEKRREFEKQLIKKSSVVKRFRRPFSKLSEESEKIEASDYLAHSDTISETNREDATFSPPLSGQFESSFVRDSSEVSEILSPVTIQPEFKKDENYRIPKKAFLETTKKLNYEMDLPEISFKKETVVKSQNSNLQDSNTNQMYSGDSNRDSMYLRGSNRDSMYSGDSNRDPMYLRNNNKDLIYSADNYKNPRQSNDSNKNLIYSADSNKDGELVIQLVRDYDLKTIRGMFEKNPGIETSIGGQRTSKIDGLGTMNVAEIKNKFEALIADPMDSKFHWAHSRGLLETRIKKNSDEELSVAQLKTLMKNSSSDTVGRVEGRRRARSQLGAGKWDGEQDEEPEELDENRLRRRRSENVPVRKMIKELEELERIKTAEAEPGTLERIKEIAETQPRTYTVTESNEEKEKSILTKSAPNYNDSSEDEELSKQKPRTKSFGEEVILHRYGRCMDERDSGCGDWRAEGRGQLLDKFLPASSDERLTDISTNLLLAYERDLDEIPLNESQIRGLALRDAKKKAFSEKRKIFLKNLRPPENASSNLLGSIASLARTEDLLDASRNEQIRRDTNENELEKFNSKMEQKSAPVLAKNFAQSLSAESDFSRFYTTSLDEWREIKADASHILESVQNLPDEFAVVLSHGDRDSNTMHFLAYTADLAHEPLNERQRETVLQYVRDSRNAALDSKKKRRLVKRRRRLEITASTVSSSDASEAEETVVELRKRAEMPTTPFVIEEQIIVHLRAGSFDSFDTLDEKDMADVRLTSSETRNDPKVEKPYGATWDDPNVERPYGTNVIESKHFEEPKPEAEFLLSQINKKFEEKFQQNHEEIFDNQNEEIQEIQLQYAADDTVVVEENELSDEATSYWINLPDNAQTWKQSAWSPTSKIYLQPEPLFSEGLIRKTSQISLSSIVEEAEEEEEEKPDTVAKRRSSRIDKKIQDETQFHGCTETTSHKRLRFRDESTRFYSTETPTDHKRSRLCDQVTILHWLDPKPEMGYVPLDFSQYCSRTQQLIAVDFMLDAGNSNSKCVEKNRIDIAKLADISQILEKNSNMNRQEESLKKTEVQMNEKDSQPFGIQENIQICLPKIQKFSSLSTFSSASEATFVDYEDQEDREEREGQQEEQEDQQDQQNQDQVDQKDQKNQEYQQDHDQMIYFSNNEIGIEKLEESHCAKVDHSEGLGFRWSKEEAQMDPEMDSYKASHGTVAKSKNWEIIQENDMVFPDEKVAVFSSGKDMVFLNRKDTVFSDGNDTVFAENVSSLENWEIIQNGSSNLNPKECENQQKSVNIENTVSTKNVRIQADTILLGENTTQTKNRLADYCVIDGDFFKEERSIGVNAGAILAESSAQTMPYDMLMKRYTMRMDRDVEKEKEKIFMTRRIRPRKEDTVMKSSFTQTIQFYRHKSEGTQTESPEATIVQGQVKEWRDENTVHRENEYDENTIAKYYSKQNENTVRRQIEIDSGKFSNNLGISVEYQAYLREEFKRIYEEILDIRRIVNAPFDNTVASENTVITRDLVARPRVDLPPKVAKLLRVKSVRLMQNLASQTDSGTLKNRSVIDFQMMPNIVTQMHQAHHRTHATQAIGFQVLPSAVEVFTYAVLALPDDYGTAESLIRLKNVEKFFFNIDKAILCDNRRFVWDLKNLYLTLESTKHRRSQHHDEQCELCRSLRVPPKVPVPAKQSQLREAKDSKKFNETAQMKWTPLQKRTSLQDHSNIVLDSQDYSPILDIKNSENVRRIAKHFEESIRDRDQQIRSKARIRKRYSSESIKDIANQLSDEISPFIYVEKKAKVKDTSVVKNTVNDTVVVKDTVEDTIFAKDTAKYVVVERDNNVTVKEDKPIIERKSVTIVARPRKTAVFELKKEPPIACELRAALAQRFKRLENIESEKKKRKMATIEKQTKVQKPNKRPHSQYYNNKYKAYEPCESKAQKQAQKQEAEEDHRFADYAALNTYYFNSASSLFSRLDQDYRKRLETDRPPLAFTVRFARPPILSLSGTQRRYLADCMPELIDALAASAALQNGDGNVSSWEPANGKSTSSVPHETWDATLLLEKFYRVDYNPLVEKRSRFRNMEGHLEVPNHEPNLIPEIENEWKKLYFRTKDGRFQWFSTHFADEHPIEDILLTGTTITANRNDWTITIKGGKENANLTVKVASNLFEKWIQALLSHSHSALIDAYVQPVFPPVPHYTQNLLLIELGTASVRAGLLTNRPSLPQVFFPAVGCVLPDGAGVALGVDAYVPGVRQRGRLESPIQASDCEKLIERHSINEPVLDACLQKVIKDLNVKPDKYKVLLSIPQNIPTKHASELLRMLIRHNGFKAASIARQPSLILYSYDVTTGVVVDIGERLNIVPVIDEYIVESAIISLPFGAPQIRKSLQKELAVRNQRIQSFGSIVEQLLLRHIVEEACYVAVDFEEEMKNPSQGSTTIDFAKFNIGGGLDPEFTVDALSAFGAPEGLFKPKRWGLEMKGIHQLIHDAIQQSPIDSRRSLYRNIYVCGGTSLLRGLCERLETELCKIAPQSIFVQVHASPWRLHASYLGAQVIANSFQFENCCADGARLEEYIQQMENSG